MAFNLRPTDKEFFALFDRAGTNILKAAKLLQTMMTEWPEDRGIAREIFICEQEGDSITHDVVHRLNNGRPTPMSHEDIYAMAVGLDDVLDYIEEVADFFGLYQVEAPMQQAQDLVAILVASCEQLAEALGRLRGFKNLDRYWVEINRLENDGDRISRDALASLFADGIDPIFVIKWKDIFSRLENAIDATETIANILENISVKMG